MKLPFINESIFESNKSPVQKEKSFYIYIYIVKLLFMPNGSIFLCIIP